MRNLIIALLILPLTSCMPTLVHQYHTFEKSSFKEVDGVDIDSWIDYDVIERGTYIYKDITFSEYETLIYVQSKVYNYTDEDIYIDLSNSYFTGNDQAYTYTDYKVERYILIPPNTYKIIKSNKVLYKSIPYSDKAGIEVSTSEFDTDNSKIKIDVVLAVKDKDKSIESFFESEVNETVASSKFKGEYDFYSIWKVDLNKREKSINKLIPTKQ